MLAHCSPSSESVPDGNTGEIRVAWKETGHPTSYAGGSGYVSSLTGTPYVRKYTGVPTSWKTDLCIGGAIMSNEFKMK